MRVTAEQKAKLQAAGAWGRFTARRDELKKTGLTPDAAFRQALDECLPDAPVADAAPVATSTPATPAQTTRRTPHISQDIFKGRKQASMLEVVEWVFNHLAIVDVGPEHAPSASAWGLLQSCREDTQLRNKFMLEVIARLLPSRQQVEAASNLIDDGKRSLDFIDSILSEGTANENRQAP